MGPHVKLIVGSLAVFLVLSGSSVLAQRGEQSVFHEGQVVAITDTEVTIKEWAGSYTYRLRPGERQTLDWAGIKPGDKVTFSAWETSQIAFDFKKR